MTVRNFLNMVKIQDHSTDARFSDGSGGKDRYNVDICMDGHGNVLDAQVRRAHVSNGMMFVYATGQASEKKNAPPDAQNIRQGGKPN